MMDSAIHLEDLYRKIGVIFQDFVRYEMTAVKTSRSEIEDLATWNDELAAKKSMAIGDRTPSLRYEQC